MTDKKLIKQEVEKLKSEYNKESNFRTVRGDTAREVLDKLLSFIDSIPEEPTGEVNCTTKSEDWEEDCSFEKILQEIYIKYDKKISIESLLDIASHFAEWGRNHFEDKSEMVSEDLEEEITKCYKSRNDLMMTRKQFEKIIHHFAEWQKNKMKEVLQTEYEKGRFDMREEMMADACDTKITTDKGSIFPIIKYQLPLTYDCKIGDKVKIIVIREEQ